LLGQGAETARATSSPARRSRPATPPPVERSADAAEAVLERVAWSPERLVREAHRIAIDFQNASGIYLSEARRPDLVSGGEGTRR